MHTIRLLLRCLLAWLVEPLPAPPLERRYVVRCACCHQRGPVGLTYLDSRVQAMSANYRQVQGWWCCGTCVRSMATVSNPKD